MKNASFVSVIHLADTDGNRLVAIYKPMSDEERQALLKRYWQENRWGDGLKHLTFLTCFRLTQHVFQTNGLKA